MFIYFAGNAVVQEFVPKDLGSTPALADLKKELLIDNRSGHYRLVFVPEADLVADVVSNKVEAGKICRTNEVWNALYEKDMARIRSLKPEAGMDDPFGVKKRIESKSGKLSDLKDLKQDFRDSDESLVRLLGWMEKQTCFPGDLRRKVAPSCVFMGLQKSGKSTTINHIIRKNLLFSLTTVATRCPTMLMLLPNDDMYAFYSKKVTRTCGNEAEMLTLVEAHMKELINTPTGADVEPIQLSIPGRNLSNNLALVLWDTPGLSFGEGTEYDSAEQEVGKKVLNDYGSKENCIVFLVETFINSTKDLGTRNVGFFAGAKRVALVITHLDEIPPDFVNRTTDFPRTIDQLILRLKKNFAPKGF